MQPERAGQSGGFNLNTLEDTALNIVEFVCSVPSRWIELYIRPWHGTRYFSPAVIFLSSLLMIVLPALSSLVTGVAGMIPFSHYQPPKGMFDISAFATLYFAASFLHGIRIWRRMLNLHLEKHSEFEGPPLPFIHLIPGSKRVGFTRIVIEPALVFIAATLLSDIYIIQSGLATLLHFSALCLAMKEFVVWYRGWQFSRHLLDMQYAGPLIAKLMNNQASEEDLAPIHIASFPKNITPEIRQSAATYIARAYNLHPSTPGESNETH